MKVLIDIPKENYEGWREHKFLGHCLSTTEEAVANGIALDNLTNGEVFHKVFPEVDVDGDIMFWHGVDWWNRKWGE